MLQSIHLRLQLLPVRDPVNNAVNVALNKVIQINFIENIKLGINPWIELKTNSGTVTPFTTTVLGNVLSIIPDSLLAAGTKFIIVLHSNSITDIPRKWISSTIHNQIYNNHSTSSNKYKSSKQCG